MSSVAPTEKTKQRQKVNRVTCGLVSSVMSLHAQNLKGLIHSCLYREAAQRTSKDSKKGRSWGEATQRPSFLCPPNFKPGKQALLSRVVADRMQTSGPLTVCWRHCW